MYKQFEHQLFKTPTNQLTMDFRRTKTMLKLLK